MMELLVFYEDGGASFDTHHHGRWLRQYWWVSITISVLYVVVMFVGKNLMMNRPPFDFRRAFVAWSCGLALFSFGGAVVLTVEFVQRFRADGLLGTVCSAAPVYNGRAGMWLWFFVLSKVVEMGDTAFIVLRKHRLSFAHWFHHASTLTFAWFVYSRTVAVARYYVTSNYAVHCVMYAYYALSAAGLCRRARRLKMAIAFVQVLQFVVALWATFYAGTQLLAGKSCDADWISIISGFQLYFAFFYLFVKFFSTIFKLHD